MRLLAIVLTLAISSNAFADQQPAYGPRLEGFDYPYPVQLYGLVSQRQPLQMAYLDVAARAPSNGRTVVLLHGKNFCAATWETSIAALAGAGYRVIAPDQIGFCKSSKPQHYQFSLEQLAANTRALLDSLGIEKSVVIGHSMGGMLAIRYALMYPQATLQLALVNPIGLEDWRAAGVPWRSVDAWYQQDLKTSFESIQKYQMDVYYAGTWKPEFARWARMQAGMYAGPGRNQVAWDQALAYDMIYSQPVVHELPKIAVPTTLFIGQKDRTAIGRDLASTEIKARLGDYPALGRRAAAAIPDAQLIEFADLGHSPQVQDPERFNAALIKALALH
ncbi:MAG: alpha/beta hydrolase [Lysobacterales bacterium 63-13]|nr:MAG: alpha/beta hydrolase [Xanthomonadales bacterium 63-13]